MTDKNEKFRNCLEKVWKLLVWFSLCFPINKKNESSILLFHFPTSNTRPKEPNTPQCKTISGSKTVKSTQKIIITVSIIVTCNVAKIGRKHGLWHGHLVICRLAISYLNCTNQWREESLKSEEATLVFPPLPSSISNNGAHVTN